MFVMFAALSYRDPEEWPVRLLILIVVHLASFQAVLFLHILTMSDTPLASLSLTHVHYVTLPPVSNIGINN
jgi:hypothetical protein